MLLFLSHINVGFIFWNGGAKSNLCPKKELALESTILEFKLFIRLKGTSKCQKMANAIVMQEILPLQFYVDWVWGKYIKNLKWHISLVKTWRSKIDT